MRWIGPASPASDTQREADAIAAALSLHPLAARILTQRGHLTPEAVQAFLADGLADLPSPFLMKGMDRAVERLLRAVRSKEAITLYGDYDVDGVCSTALMTLFLKALGAQVTAYIPHRLDEGYGLNLAAVEKLAASGTRVLVTLDCGISSEAEVARAAALGVDTVVVDHHTVPLVMPSAVAILNPHQPGCDYPTQHLCAAGVAFNLCLALRKTLRDSGGFGTRPEPNLRALMDLVAMATVADVVPLTGANRVLVKHGLAVLTEAERPGVRALKDVAGLTHGQPMTSGQIGFRLGPRINAAGRLNDASIGLRLLCAETLEEARPLAEELDRANAQRQALEANILEAAMAQAESRASASHCGLVLYSDAWHAGVVGIVASRVVERFHRPTILVAVRDGMGKGSGRSIEGFHLVDALRSCSDHLSKFGGHRHAAGLSIEAERLPAFAEAFSRYAGERLRQEDLVPRCRVDAWVQPEELDEAAVQGLGRLAPFGAGNPEPVLACRAQRATGRVLKSKQEKRADHLKLTLDQAPSLDVIGFGMGPSWDDLGGSLSNPPVDLAFNLGVDEFRGVSRLSLKLKALRAVP